MLKRNFFLYPLLLFFLPIGLIVLWTSSSIDLYKKYIISIISILLNVLLSLFFFVSIHNILFNSSDLNETKSFSNKVIDSPLYISNPKTVLGVAVVKKNSDSQNTIYIKSNRTLTNKQNLRIFMRTEVLKFKNFNEILIDLDDGYAIQIHPNYSFIHYGKKKDNHLYSTLESYWINNYSGDIKKVNDIHHSRNHSLF